MKNKIPNPNPKKFRENRSVEPNWELIPMYYTGIKHPQNKNKELVLMEFFGKSVSACWRNHETAKLGIRFLLKSEPAGVWLKGRMYQYSKMNAVW